MTEEWRYVGCCERHMVSNHGRLVGMRNNPLHPTRQKPKGYFVVNLHGTIMPLRYVHEIVAAAFLGPRPAGFEINHIDGDKLNNLVTNLEYVTPEQNRHHAASAGLLRRGERHARAKLTDAEAEEIRESAEGSRALAERFHVSQSHINSIKAGRFRKAAAA